jgi:NAD(P)-dependent dehydrogenase (short-subunit alcohol dehydrogenase family)
MAMYSASRAALELLTKAWAAEYGPRGVRVNAVAPGPTRTWMTKGFPGEMVNQLAALAPAGLVAEPEELAAAIAFLACDVAASSTASLSRSTRAEWRRNSRRRRRLKVKI